MRLSKVDAGEGSWGLQAQGVEHVKDPSPLGSKGNTSLSGGRMYEAVRDAPGLGLNLTSTFHRLRDFWKVV